MYIHIFTKNHDVLQTNFMAAVPRLKRDGMLWLSWPKKSSGIMSKLDKKAIRQYGLDKHMVDTIDTNWSGHRFMYRIIDRS